MTRQTWTAIVSGVLFILLAVAIAVPSVNFVAWAPGPTYDVLGREGDQPVINISNTQVYETHGSLHLTTVSVTRPDSTVSLPEAVLSFLLPERDVLPREAQYPVGVPVEQMQRDDAEAMTTSQRVAVAAALRAAGHQVDQVVVISGVSEAGPAFGRLQTGDIIDAVDGLAVSTRADLDRAVLLHTVGDLVQFDIERDGEKLKTSLTTVAANDDPRAPRIGIEIRTGYRYDPEVTFNVGNSIVGPSAGLIFALGVYDIVSPEDLIAGRSIAGTGDIGANGAVSPISGTLEKLAAAESAGATIFLLPAGNCPDIAGVDTDLTLVKVTELSDAIASLQLLKQPNRAAEVPRC